MGSISKRLRRQNVGEVKRKAYEQGARRAVNVMTQDTKDKLGEAYQIGFSEGNATAQLLMTVVMLAAARGVYGFGKIRLERLAKEVAEITTMLNDGKTTLGEIMQMLTDERISFLDKVTVTDGDGHDRVITLEEILAKEKKVKSGARVA